MASRILQILLLASFMLASLVGCKPGTANPPGGSSLNVQDEDSSAGGNTGNRGNGDNNKSITGTGDPFSGGGNYLSRINQFRKNGQKTIEQVLTGNNLSRFCVGVAGVSSLQAAAIQSLFVEAAPILLQKISSIPMIVTPNSLTVVHEGISYAVRGRYRPATEQYSEGIEISRQAWDDGEGFAIAFHELMHAALPRLRDYVSVGTLFTGHTGGQDELDRLGACAKAAYTELVEHSAEFAPDFSENGWVYLDDASDFTAQTVFTSIAEQTAGRILVSYSTAHFLPALNRYRYRTFVRRFKPDGSIDSDFGVNGVLIVPLRSFSSACGGRYMRSLSIQSDNSILLGGWDLTQDGKYFPLVLRYDADGKVLDTGLYNTLQVYLYTYFSANQWFQDVRLQSDGKILAIGIHLSTVGGVPVYRSGAYRFLPDGRVDREFGNNGALWISPSGVTSNIAQRVTFAPDGKIVIVGYGFHSESPVAWANIAYVARLAQNGVLDNSFAGRGSRLVPYGVGYSNIEANAVVVQADRKVVIGGSEGVPGGQRNAVIIRLNEDGTYDATFGESRAGRMDPLPIGAGKPFIASRITSLALQDDGKILAGGSSLVGSTNRATILRALRNGVLDATFDTSAGSAGVSRFGFSNNLAAVQDINILENGRILLSGIQTGLGLFIAELLGNDVL